MPSPVSAVAVSVPVRSSWLESSKMLSDVDLLRLRRLRRDAEQRRVAPRPAAGPRRAASGRRPSCRPRPRAGRGCRSAGAPLRERLEVLAAGRRATKFGSATSGTVTGMVPVWSRRRSTTAAHCVTVSVASLAAGSGVASCRRSCSTSSLPAAVPADRLDLEERRAEPLILNSWPSRKPRRASSCRRCA